MFRPLIVDLSALLVALALGAFAFCIGRMLHHFPKKMQIGLVGVAVIIVTGGVVSLFGMLPYQIQNSLALSLVGGSAVLLSLAALFLLGAAWSAPNRRFSRGFLACISALAGCILLIEGSGPLLWRYGGSELWNNNPDAQGRLRQTSGLTCSPAAAAMLLHCYGIQSSEGEMAYLAGTSLFGSDAKQIVRALNEKVNPRGFHALTRRSDYEACIGRSEPFLAHTWKSNQGHAILVKRLTPDYVVILDPLNGADSQLSRSEFEAIWDGTVVEVIRSDE